MRVRAATDDGPKGIVDGVVSVYDVDYPIGQRLNECIKPGALDESIRERNVIPVFLQHDHKAGPIGHATVGLSGTDVPIEAQLYLEDSERARAVFRAQEAGAITQWSVGMKTPLESDVRIRTNPDGSRTEEILRAELFEVSVVLSGANPMTSTSRTRADGDDEMAQIEQAKAAIKIIAGLIQGEATGLAEGDASEAYDIAMLVDAVQTLQSFIYGEEAEAVSSSLTGDYVLRAVPKPVRIPVDFGSRRAREIYRSSAPSVSKPSDATASSTK